MASVPETAAGPPRLAVRELVVHRGDRAVLDRVGFEVRAGEVFGFLGPNGAGKTTLFHTLTGLLTSTSGRIELDGEAVLLGSRALRRRTGVVFQEPALDPRLTARENLVLAARLHRVSRAAARQRTEALLDAMEMSARADELVSKLSGGMRRRIDLVRALLHEPSVLVLDEPTSGLDQRAFRRIWDHLLQLRRERRLTLLVNTHNAEEADHCDRLAVIDRGRVVAVDTPAGLRDRVPGDLIILETDEVEAVAAVVSERFGIETRMAEGRVLLERERGHELIPRLVESLPAHTFRSVGLRRVGLGEVFLELTGRELDPERAP